MYGVIFSKMTKWWLHIPFFYWLTGYRKQEVLFKKMIDIMTSDILEKRRKAISVSSVINNDAIGIVDRFIMDGLSDAEIKLEAFTLFTTVFITLKTSKYLQHFYV